MSTNKKNKKAATETAENAAAPLAEQDESASAESAAQNEAAAALGAAETTPEQTASENPAPEAPASAAPKMSELKDVERLIKENGLPAWQGAALLRARNWAPGKRVTPDEFASALEQLKSRRQGG